MFFSNKNMFLDPCESWPLVIKFVLSPVPDLTIHQSYHNFQDWSCISENIPLLLAHISFVHKYARYASKIKVSHAFTTALI
jgi:hypothetical protein